MYLLSVILIVLYVLSMFCCLEPLASKDIELTFPVLLLIMCPIVNTIIALKYAKWSDVKRIFKSKDTPKKGKFYLCIDNKIGDFTIGKVYKCEQNDYLEDDSGSSDIFGEYKNFHKCFVEYGN